jgi:hypothetical protein
MIFLLAKQGPYREESGNAHIQRGEHADDITALDSFARRVIDLARRKRIDALGRKPAEAHRLQGEAA